MPQRASFYDINIKLYNTLQEKEFLWNLLLGKMQIIYHKVEKYFTSSLQNTMPGKPHTSKSI